MDGVIFYFSYFCNVSMETFVTGNEIIVIDPP